MSTRLLDMGSHHLLPHLIENKDESEAVNYYQSILWMDILISLSADQMFRQHVQSRVSGKDVVAYILKDLEFPRAVTHCLNEIQACIKSLPNGQQITKDINALHKQLYQADIKKLYENGLHEFLDTIQLEFANLNNEIEAKWFLD
ncbi:MAG: alpha-E domain-containing protein [Gammaproteobacteria bacterium]